MPNSVRAVFVLGLIVAGSTLPFERRTSASVLTMVSSMSMSEMMEGIQESIQAAAVARELAEEQLRAEEIRFKVGLSTNYLVVRMQRELAAAQELELRAILDYQRAQIEFDRAQRASRAGPGVTVVVGGP